LKFGQIDIIPLEDLTANTKVYVIEFWNVVTPKTSEVYYGSAKLLNKNDGVIFYQSKIPLLPTIAGNSLSFIDLSLKEKAFNNAGSVGQFKFQITPRQNKLIVSSAIWIILPTYYQALPDTVDVNCLIDDVQTRCSYFSERTILVQDIPNEIPLGK
jgi:hypothetical protein